MLAVDADNTLWGGIVGEDGPDGIAIGDSFPGNAYRALQQGLVYQAANGALIAIVSKNNEARRRRGLRRRRPATWSSSRAHLAARRVDWNSKADNLRSIADELNLGLDSFVFIDDNDVELDEVRQRLPGVEVVKVSDEPAEIARLTAGADRRSGSPGSPRRTAERTAMVQVDAERQCRGLDRALARGVPPARSGLTVRVFRAVDCPAGPRSTQLINKTNQFNLTTVRRDEAEVVTLASLRRRTAIYAAEVADRFGDYGLVAVAIVDCATRASWEIDTFLMSCRVLRRGVEDAILQVHRRRRLRRRRDTCCAASTGRRRRTARWPPSTPDRGFRRDRRGAIRGGAAADVGSETTSRSTAMLDSDPFRYFSDLLVLDAASSYPLYFLTAVAAGPTAAARPDRCLPALPDRAAAARALRAASGCSSTCSSSRATLWRDRAASWVWTTVLVVGGADPDGHLEGVRRSGRCSAST